MSTSSAPVYAGLMRRGVAYLIDCTVVFGVFAITQLLLFAPLRALIGIEEQWFYSGFNTQLYTLLTISLPVWLYFAWFEQSAWQATLGKRLLRLQVVGASTQQRISFGTAFLRTLMKLVPWEVAHLANNLPTPIWYATDPGFRIGFAVAGVLMGVYMVLVAITARHQGLHDLVARTTVRYTPPL